MNPQTTGRRNNGIATTSLLLATLACGVASAQQQNAPPPLAQSAQEEKTEPAGGNSAKPPATESSEPSKPPQESPKAGEMGEVTITGSRIRVEPGLTTPTPVTVITSDDLNKLGPTTIADALAEVPAFLNNVNASNGYGSNVPAAQGENVNLRGLGPNRTLTLLNGRRVVPGSKIGTVNIANFPTAAIKSVDVVTGGASAVYGTDAVAGVANFILDTQFTGLKFNVQGGITSRADNPNGKTELTWGTNLGEHTHLILSGNLYYEKGIHDEMDRDWFTHEGTILNPNGTTPRRVRANDLVPTDLTCGGLIIAPGTPLNRLEFNPDGSATPFVNSAISSGDLFQSLSGGSNGGSGCNPKNPSNAGPELTNDVFERNIFSYLSHDVNDNVNVFFQGIFGHSAVTTNGASSTIRSPWQMTIFRDNAFLPPDIAALMDQSGVTSFRLQRDVRDWLTDTHLDIINTNVSLTTGFGINLETGGFLNGWHIDGYYQYGRNKQENAFFDFLRTQTLNVAIDAVRNPANGQIVCHAALVNPLFKDCVPLNIFGDGRASQSAIDYVTTPKNGGIDHFFINREDVAELSANGKIADGWGAGAISGALGGSYRKESINSYQIGLSAMYDTPTNSTPGVRGVPSGYAGDPDVQYFGSFANVNGSFNVKEAFAEGLVPLVANLPFIKQINFTPAVRWADYSGSGTIWAWKLGLEWDLNSQFRIRATRSRDVRAATLAERFDQQRANGTVQDDPVTGGTYNFSQTTGGNPNVQPEKADTTTFGVVYQPSWLEGFSATVDAYDIAITDAIGQLTTQDLIDRCYQGAQDLCALITRDPTTQAVTNVNNLYININKERARGLDVEVHYSKRLDGTFLELFPDLPEDISVRFLGSRLFKRSTLIPGAPEQNLVGNIPSGVDIRQPAYPKVVWTGIFTYTAGPFSLYLQEHYIDGGYVNPTDIVGVTIDNNSVSPAWYTDLRLSYAFKNGWEVYAQGINLLDQDPPVTPQLGVQTNTGYYDVKGQRFVVGRAPGAVILGRQGSKIVYDLSQLIIRGSLAPGAMLTEAELALRFGVSRTPIRQALGILLEEGLLQRTSGRGFTVRKFAQREILDAIEVRAVLEGLAVRSLAEKKSVARVIRELDEILGLEAALLGQMETSPLTEELVAGYYALNTRFHGIIVAGAQNESLTCSLENASRVPFVAVGSLARFKDITDPASVRNELHYFIYSHMQHCEIADAVRGGQGAQAEAIMRSHALLSTRNLSLDTPNTGSSLLP